MKIHKNIKLKHDGLYCLRNSDKTGKLKNFKPNINDDDPERQKHYQELLNLTRPYRNLVTHSYSGHTGPHIEETWIAYFCCNRSLSEFGGFIPLFVDWLNYYKMMIMRLHRPKSIYNKIFNALKPEYLYVTVAMSDWGIEGFSLPLPPNLLVLSPSGHGHVSIPYLIKDLRWRPRLNRSKPLVFAGSLHGNNLRQRMDRVAKKIEPGYYWTNGNPEFWKIYKSARLSLSPRGLSRGCFRTSELFLIGAVMVYVHDGIPWIPYNRPEFHWEKMAFFTHINDFEKNYNKFKQVTDEQLDKMEEEIRNKRSFYTYKGLNEQIELFLKRDDRTMLSCEVFPNTQ